MGENDPKPSRAPRAATGYKTSTMPPRLHRETHFAGQLLTAQDCLDASLSLTDIFVATELDYQLRDNPEVQVNAARIPRFVVIPTAHVGRDP